MNTKETILFGIPTTQHDKQTQQKKKTDYDFAWKLKRSILWTQVAGKIGTPETILFQFIYVVDVEFEEKRQVIYFHFLCVSKFYWKIVDSLLHFAFTNGDEVIVLKNWHRNFTSIDNSCEISFCMTIQKNEKMKKSETQVKINNRFESRKSHLE